MLSRVKRIFDGFLFPSITFPKFAASTPSIFASAINPISSRFALPHHSGRLLILTLSSSVFYLLRRLRHALKVLICQVVDGYEPTIGIMHEGRDGSSKFVFDLMEPDRP
jgi:hypothetical protein